MRRLFLAVLPLLLPACSSWDPSGMGAQIDRSQCRAEADRYPGAIEACEGIGRGAPRLP